ncbi:DMT family transporter [Rhodoblastus acidophilus]|uniref:DMT family transporter n=1 Tax=Candidatus Rhodoblastus alkanivorans TaxID=2954117 RepID=A0ABS9ZAP9_9HYPH|nr:DMT family transporter [Candidatus Rhodoblastus alkanivorans]MCI4677192.1 DMT family transporter [Candidatus Rhodoblastus alkanivorans]MCI4684545.1 DMT family transporter [Candidatus Rhodoblastus alkanivorans]MDI4641866.1 DMT family transporter [Rhodoblastus acidophilus]
MAKVRANPFPRVCDLRAYFGRATRSLNERAGLLLILTSAMWGANGVVSRAAVGAIPPMTLVALRWLIVCAILLPLVREPFVRHLPELRRHWRFLAAMALCGYTGFNVLFYLAGHWTTAVNITLLQGAIPPMVLAGAALFKGEKVFLRQILGMAVSFLGVGLIATRGDLTHIAGLSVNFGDMLMLAACALYAGYTIALRGRPRLPPLVFFAGMAVAALVASLPFFAAEVALGHFFWPSTKGFALVVFVAVAPSLTSQLFFMRAVELIGPGRAGIFTNLTPLFGALFAILLLGEPFHLYHAGAMALGLVGIALAESAKRQRIAPA